MNLRKLMFVLPNAFTVSSIFCGFYAVTLCANDPGPREFYQAAIAIFFAIFFDGFDGRVARLTKTQSDFGVELDSLADVCSFGIAPALLAYKWALQPLGFWGIFVAFAFAACGALRLARFNVLAHRGHAGSSSFFVGLPIPLGAGMLIALVIAHHLAGESTPVPRGPFVAVMIVLSLLMVSTVRYRTFKDARLSKKSALIFLMMCALGVVVATQLGRAYVLVAYFSAYLLMGLIEAIVALPKRRAERVATKAGAAAAAATMDEDELADDEDDEPGVEEEEFI